MNKVNFKDLPYRNNVASIVFKKKHFLLVQLVDWPDNFWKFPQGGVHEGETEEEAVCRELIEELGIGNFKIMGKSSYTNRYDWPADSIEKAGFKWKGQLQKFYLVEFSGENSEIRINKKEIQRWKWLNKEELFSHIDHDHKLFVNYRNVIAKVLAEFKDLLG